MKIYISGKITGDENHEAKFAEAERRLREAGFDDVVNPVLFARQGENWKVSLRRDMAHLTYCDAVALLPDWEESRDVKIEVGLARELGISVRAIEDWILLIENQGQLLGGSMWFDLEKVLEEIKTASEEKAKVMEKVLNNLVDLFSWKKDLKERGLYEKTFPNGF
jgi:hypothetical protein